MTNKPQFVGERVKLGDVLKSSSTRNKDSNCVNVYSVTNSKGFVPSEEYFSKEVFSKELRTYRVVERGMIAYNPSRINVGSVALQDKADEVVVSPLYVVFSTDGSKLMPEYLVHFLKSKPGLDQIAFQSIGTVRNNLKFKALCQMELHIPPLGEQQARINTLREIQLQIERAESQIDELDSLVKSRFVEMFGDGDFPCFRLDEIADVQGGLTKNRRREALPMQLPYLRVANVGSEGGVDTSEVLSIGLTSEEAGKTLLKADDLLFVEGNGSKDQIGRAAIWDGSIDPCVHQNHLIRVRLHDSVLPVFALAFFSSSVGRRQITDKAASTSGLFTLSTGKIKSLESPVPPLSLQQEFAAFASQIDKSRFVALGGKKRIPFLFLMWLRISAKSVQLQRDLFESHSSPQRALRLGGHLHYGPSSTARNHAKRPVPSRGLRSSPANSARRIPSCRITKRFHRRACGYLEADRSSRIHP